MAARCNDCNRFTGYENEAEITQDFEYNDGTVSGTVRVVRNCAECGTEKTETSFDLEAHVTLPEGHEGEGHEIEVEADDPEVTERLFGGINRKTGKENKITNPRYAKTMIGACVDFRVICECGETLAEGQVSDDLQASAYDELQ